MPARPQADRSRLIKSQNQERSVRVTTSTRNCVGITAPALNLVNARPRARAQPANTKSFSTSVRGGNVSSVPGKSNIGGVDLAGLLSLASILAVAFLPVFFGRRSSPPGQSDSDSEDGWGGGRRQPPGPSKSPNGGIPLDDAEPARPRLRDSRRLADRLPARERRQTREPDRRPARTVGPGCSAGREPFSE